MRKIYLHAGLGKTGSSLIQSWLADNESELAELGVCFRPDYPSTSIYQTNSGNGEVLLQYLAQVKRGETPSPYFIEHYFPPNSNAAIISSELFHVVELDSLQELARVLREHDIQIKVIVFYRNAVDHVISLYIQHIKRQGTLLSIVDWFDTEYGKLDQYKALQRLDKCFDVVALNYSQNKNRLTDVFADSLDFDTSSLKKPLDYRVNRSFDPYEIEVFIRFLERAIALGLDRKAFAKALSDAVVDDGDKSKKTGVVLSDELKSQLLGRIESWSKANHSLAEKIATIPVGSGYFVPKLGKLNRLRYWKFNKALIDATIDFLVDADEGVAEAFFALYDKTEFWYVLYIRFRLRKPKVTG